MIVLEYKLVASDKQKQGIEEALRTVQFVRNACLRLWMDARDSDKTVGKYDLSNHSTQLRKAFKWCKKLGSQAGQAAAERTWAAISRFYENCKKGVKPVGFPRFQKNNRSVEYKQTGWKLDAHHKKLTLTDGFQIGTLKLKGTWDLMRYRKEDIKRVRILRRADGYYAQFCINVERHFDLEPTGRTLGLDVGLKSFYTDSNGDEQPNPRFYRKAEQGLKTLQRRVSRKVQGSQNRKKAIDRLGRKHLKVQRQRKDFAVQLARCVVMSNDVVVFEDLNVKNMIRNKKLSKSMGDVSWRLFRTWVEYYGKIMGKIVLRVNPAYTTQICSSCGTIIKKDLKTRTHVCVCGLVMDRDQNAAINILKAGLRTAGHAGTQDARPGTLVEMEEDLHSGASV